MIYTKRIEDIKEYDVVVCGGGPAGFSAAVQCGRESLRTALLEHFGALGGNMTVGGISTPGLFHAWKKQVIGGIGWELMTRLAERGWAVLPDVHSGEPDERLCVKVNSFAAAHLIDVMCDEAGVDLYLHHDVFDTVCDKKNDGTRIEGVLACAKEGIKAFRSKVFIDCTGDGDVAAWSGADFELGEAGSGELQAGSLSFFMTGIDRNRISANDVSREFNQALENRELMAWDYWPGVTMSTPASMFERKGRNHNHIAVDGSDSMSRSKADLEGRESVMRLMEWLRKHVKGAEGAEPVFTCPQVWPRESRRIRGREYITVDDYVSGRTYEDGVCNSYYPLYVHKSTAEHEDPGNLLETTKIPEGIVPSIPAGALVPRDMSNLLVAGRCISGDRKAFSSYRIQATCMATGQAAGAIAVDLCSRDTDTAHYNINSVRRILENHDAIMP